MKTIDRIRDMVPTEQITESIVEYIGHFAVHPSPTILKSSSSFYIMEQMGFIGQEMETKGNFRLNARARRFYHNLKQEGYFPLKEQD